MPTKLLPILFFLCFNVRTIAQDSCVSKRFFQITQLVERAFPFKEENYSSKLPEFYVIDIKINDSSGKIENIDCFRKNNSVHYERINQAVLKIKKDWKPLYCGAKRLLIPVFIFFESDEDFSEYPFDIQNDKVHGVFVHKTININIPSNKRYK